MKVSVVFPIHNAELILGAGLQDMGSFFERLPLEMQFVFVVEPHSESEQNLIRRFADKYKKFQVKIHQNQQKLGRGSSVLAGLRESDGDVILVGSIDFSTPLAEFLNFIQEFMVDSKIQFAIGNRNTAKKKRGGKISKTKAIFEKIENEKLSASGIRLADPITPFFAIRKDIFKQIEGEIHRVPNWFYLSGLLVPALNLKVPITELPIHFEDSPSQNFKWWKCLF